MTMEAGGYSLCANCPKYLSRELVNWAKKHRITTLYIQPGKRTPNTNVERFNRTDRRERLDLYLFDSVEYAQELATPSLWLYDNERPNMTIEGISPS